MASCGACWGGDGSGTGRDRSFRRDGGPRQVAAAAGAGDAVAFLQLDPCDSDGGGDGDDGRRDCPVADLDGVRSCRVVAFDHRRASSGGCDWCGLAVVGHLEDRC